MAISCRFTRQRRRLPFDLLELSTINRIGLDSMSSTTTTVKPPGRTEPVFRIRPIGGVVHHREANVAYSTTTKTNGGTTRVVTPSTTSSVGLIMVRVSSRIYCSPHGNQDACHKRKFNSFSCKMFFASVLRLQVLVYVRPRMPRTTQSPKEWM